MVNCIVENVEFQQLIKSLDPYYPLPSRALLGKQLDKVLVDLKAQYPHLPGCSPKSKFVYRSKKAITSSYLEVMTHFFPSHDHLKHCVALAV